MDEQIFRDRRQPKKQASGLPADLPSIRWFQENQHLLEPDDELYDESLDNLNESQLRKMAARHKVSGELPTIRWFQDHEHLLESDEFLGSMSEAQLQKVAARHGPGCPSCGR